MKWFRGQWGYCGVRSGEHPPPSQGKAQRNSPSFPVLWVGCSPRSSFSSISVLSPAPYPPGNREVT